jgi:adenosylcobinamide-GDP ribazoletransferase
LISGLFAAIAFLTRLPVGRRAAFDAGAVARSMRWFPLIGALLGAISVAALRLLTPLFPPLVVAVLLAGLDALLTGCLHLDGLADTADGFGGGSKREDVLRIIRDHAIGSYGAVALIVAIGLRIVALAALIDARRVVAALLLAPAIGRWTAPLLSATQPYAREGAGSPAREVGWTELAIATLTAVAIVAAVDWRRGFAAFVLTAAGAAAWAWICRRRIGGVTGDTLGAAVEASECLTLLVFAARW